MQLIQSSVQVQQRVSPTEDFSKLLTSQEIIMGWASSSHYVLQCITHLRYEFTPNRRRAHMIIYKRIYPYNKIFESKPADKRSNFEMLRITVVWHVVFPAPAGHRNELGSITWIGLNSELRKGQVHCYMTGPAALLGHSGPGHFPAVLVSHEICSVTFHSG